LTLPEPPGTFPPSSLAANPPREDTPDVRCHQE